jgi:hypothetical protein
MAGCLCLSTGLSLLSYVCPVHCFRGHPPAKLGAVDHHRGRQVGGDHDTDGPPLFERSGFGGKEILALRPIGGEAPPDQRRAAPAANRGNPHRRHELLEFLGRICRSVPQDPQRFSRPRAGEKRAQSLDA